MVMIRLKKKDWAKAWREMIDIGPVTLIAPDPVYVVLPAHMEMLTKRGYPFELVTTRPRRARNRRHRTAD
jgi:hypothetical protein